MYVETDGRRIWVDDRLPKSHQDPYERATETLVRDVERYLYADILPDGSENPAYRNVDFLNWAVARWETCKNGSGQGYYDQDWTPGETPLRPIPEPEDRSTPASFFDMQITPKKGK